MFNYFNQNKLTVLFLLLWIGTWGSLNTFVPVTDNIFNGFAREGFSRNIIFSIISALRFYLPIFFSIIFFSYLIFIQKVAFKKNSFLLLYLIFFLSQFLGLIIYDFSEFNLERNFLPLFAINVIILLYFANIYLNSEQLRKIFFINISFLIIISLFYLPFIYKDYFTNSQIFFYNTQTWRLTVLDDPMIRVTGLSRILAIVFIFFIITFEYSNNNISKFLLILLLILVSANIWALQSRGTFLCLGLSLIIYLFLIYNKNFLKNITLYALIFILGIGLFKVIQTSKEYYVSKYYPKLFKLYSSNITEKDNRIIEAYLREDGQNNQDKISYVTSSRNDIWKKIIEKYDYKRIFGYGPQADRYVILKNEEPTEIINNKVVKTSGFMTNASSSLFYSFICGGYFGLISFCFLNLYILLLLLKYLKIRTYFTKNKAYSDSLFLIIIFIGLRSFFENSHAVFSLDFIVFISSCIMLEKEIKRNESVNQSSFFNKN